MIACATDSGAVSKALTATNGAKQDCILALTFFCFMFSAMLMDAYRDERPGIRIAYGTDGQLLIYRRMHFQSRVSTTSARELLFPDDCALNTASEGDMKMGVDLFSAACDNLGFINTEKTVHAPTATRRCLHCTSEEDAIAATGYNCSEGCDLFASAVGSV
nr:unnamed protein product [Spirometra erinaceieuropaei]